MVKKNYEGEWNGEMILERNPNGGRPMRIGSMLFSHDDYRQEVGNIQEETHIRYHLGYCCCGRKIAIGPKKAEFLVQIIKKSFLLIEGEGPKPHKPLWMRLLKATLAGAGDNS